MNRHCRIRSKSYPGAGPALALRWAITRLAAPCFVVFEAWARCSRNLEVLMLPRVSLGFLCFAGLRSGASMPSLRKSRRLGQPVFGWRTRESKAGQPPGEGSRSDCTVTDPRNVQDEFTPDDTALTVSPSWPLKIFWQPSYTPAKSDADQGFGVGINPNPNNSGVNIFNEAILFHEALHGRTGKWDAQIQLILGLPSPASSENISIYIKNIVLGYCPSFK